MSGRHHQPLKQEPTIKQEYNINDIPQYHYPPVDSFSQLIDPFPSAAFVPTMTYQYSSDSYYSSSTQESCQDSIQGSRQDSIQDSSGYYDQTTDQWVDFEAPDEYATSPVQDNSFPSSMPRYCDEHAYPDNDMQQTPAAEIAGQKSKYVHLILDRGVFSNFRQHQWQGRNMAMFCVPKSLYPLCGFESSLHHRPQSRCCEVRLP
jgi:hypothetical protein